MENIKGAEAQQYIEQSISKMKEALKPNPIPENLTLEQILKLQIERLEQDVQARKALLIQIKETSL